MTEDDMPKSASGSAHGTVASHGIAVGLALIPIPDDHPVLRQIGQIAAKCAEIEFTLDRMIWHLSGVATNIGSSITSQLSGPVPRIRALTNLCHIKGKDHLIRQLNGLKGRAREPFDKRNRLVHDVWMQKLRDVNVVGQMRPQNKSQQDFGFLEVEISDFGETAAELDAIKMECIAIFDEILKP